MLALKLDNMKLDIPFFSQLDSDVPVDVQRISCALASTKMVIRYKGETISFSDLQKEAQIIGGKQRAGWSHETVVRIMRNHGVPAYAQEFFGQTIDLKDEQRVLSELSKQFKLDGFEKIKKSISNQNPVLVSVSAGFSKNEVLRKSLNIETHVVVLSGFEDDVLTIHDPIFDAPTIVSREHFMKYWRGLAIFTE